MRRAVGALSRSAQSALAQGSRVVTTSAPAEAAAAAAAASSAKAPHLQEFQVYRWNPDSTEKPHLQTYKARAPGALPWRGAVLRLAAARWLGSKEQPVWKESS